MLIGLGKPFQRRDYKSLRRFRVGGRCHLRGRGPCNVPVGPGCGSDLEHIAALNPQVNAIVALEEPKALPYSRTSCPDPTKSAGGSSGGAAVALALRMVPPVRTDLSTERFRGTSLVARSAYSDEDSRGNGAREQGH